MALALQPSTPTLSPQPQTPDRSPHRANQPPRDLHLALDDVVHLEHFRVAWVDPQLGQDRPQTLTKRFKLLLRIPDLTDLEVPLRAKAELVVESVGGKDPGLIEATDDFVVLLCPQGRRRETDYQAHERAPYSGVATLTFSGTSREPYCCFSSKALVRQSSRFERPLAARKHLQP